MQRAVPERVLVKRWSIEGTILTEGHEEVGVDLVRQFLGFPVAGALAVLVVEAEAHQGKGGHGQGYAPKDEDETPEGLIRHQLEE